MCQRYFESLKLKVESLKLKDERKIVRRLLGLLVLSIFSFQFSIYAADSVKDLQKKQRKLQQEIEQTNNMLKQTKKDETATLNKLQLTQQNIKNQKKLIRTLDNEITALDREMKALVTPATRCNRCWKATKRTMPA
jgi:peptidoglycan hydrolase CwlO-like protein